MARNKLIVLTIVSVLGCVMPNYAFSIEEYIPHQPLVKDHQVWLPSFPEKEARKDTQETIKQAKKQILSILLTENEMLDYRLVAGWPVFGLGCLGGKDGGAAFGHPQYAAAQAWNFPKTYPIRNVAPLDYLLKITLCLYGTEPKVEQFMGTLEALFGKTIEQLPPVAGSRCWIIPKGKWDFQQKERRLIFIQDNFVIIIAQIMFKGANNPKTLTEIAAKMDTKIRETKKP